MSDLDYTPIEIPLWIEIGFIPAAICVALLMVYVPIFLKARKFSQLVRTHFADLPQSDLEATLRALRWPIFKMSVKFIDRGNPYESAKRELVDVAQNEKDFGRAVNRSLPAMLSYLANWTDRFRPPVDPAEDIRFVAEQQKRVAVVLEDLRNYLRTASAEMPDHYEAADRFSDLHARLAAVWKEWLDARHLPVAIHRALHQW